MGRDDGGAKRPELFGPVIVAGSPLSYWAGVRGENPMRYTGGLLGGSWLTALMGDLGNGIFDGAWLVSNFESLNPANTLLEQELQSLFEGGHRGSTLSRVRGVVERPRPAQCGGDAIHRRQLFIGNKLATAEIVSSDGTTIDLRNIKSPIVVFCSKADNITPPPQALGLDSRSL